MGSPTLREVRAYVTRSAAVLNAMLNEERLLAAIANAAEIACRSIDGGGKIIFAGNGGSAADAQHFAGELVSRFNYDRPGIGSISLSTDTSVITSIANDYGYAKLFSRQIEALGKKGDVFIAISTSGRSANIIEGLRAARLRGLINIGLTGGSGGDMPQLCDVEIRVPSGDTPLVQQGHLVVGHLLCGLIESHVHPRAAR